MPWTVWCEVDRMSRCCQRRYLTWKARGDRLWFHQLTKCVEDKRHTGILINYSGEILHQHIIVKLIVMGASKSFGCGQVLFGIYMKYFTVILMLYCHFCLRLIQMKWLPTEQHVIVWFVALLYIFKQTNHQTNQSFCTRTKNSHWGYSIW